SFPSEFHYDDYPELIHNPQITQEDFRFGWFLDHYGGRPLTLWTFHWSYRLFGEVPLGHHAISFALHLLAVCGVFLAVKKVLPEHLSRNGSEGAVTEQMPFWTGLIFALHPLQTQAVNYIWSRSVLLMAVFSLAALLAVRRRPWLALALAQLAVWSRTEALLLFLLLIFLDRRRWKAPALLAALNLGAFALSLIRYAPSEVGWNHSDQLAFYLAQPVVLLKYLGMMAWPAGLNIDHHVLAPSFLGSVAALVLTGVLGVGCWRFRRRHPAAVLGIVWACAWLAPSLLIPNTDWVNESRTYLAMAGLALTAGWALASLAALKQRTLLTAAALSILLAMIPVTLHRNQLWQDDVKLYQDAASKSPAKARVRYNLGSALARVGRVAEAEREYRQALRLQPLNDLHHSALGYCAEMQQRWCEARDHYEKALQLNLGNQRALEGLDRLALAFESEEKL
ncbi:MAG: tetratricopeptide repeat protein, partial [Acidobacteriota bacterium]